MIQFWSSWNFSWWLASEMGLCPVNGPLKTSVLFTSVIGGYMTHIYPRKIVFLYKSKKIQIPYKYCILLDLVGHQLPLYRLLTNSSDDKQKLCGAYAIIPISVYSIVNYLRQVNIDRIYGIKMYKIYATSFFVGTTYGLFSHYKSIQRVALKLNHF